MAQRAIYLFGNRMLKLTLAELKDSLPAFSNLVNQRINASAKISYNLGKTWRSIQTETEHLRENEITILKKYGAVETPNGWKVDPDKLSEAKKAKLEKELDDLYAVEIEVWGTKLKLEEIENAAISLTPAQFAQLDWLIADPEGETANNSGQANAASA